MAEARRARALITWNVLHRVHGENWSEDPIARYPDERVRIAGVASTVKRWLDDGVDAVCLQEVSGDQLAALRAAVGGSASCISHRYPRMPKLRRGALALADASEHLVVIARGPARSVTARTFDSDPGKGMLGVALDDDAGEVLLVDTHVSFGDRRRAQLAAVAAFARGASSAIVAGDLNASADDVLDAMGEGFTISRLAKPTRIATKEHGGKTIDHVIVRNAVLEECAVLDGEGLSDHHPVTARVIQKVPPLRNG